MLLPRLIVLLASLSNAAELFYPHGITLAPRVVNTSIPTITLSPNTNFLSPLVRLSMKHFRESITKGKQPNVSVTGAQMELVTNAPGLSGDALLALGPDAAANLDSVYRENCPNGLESPNCESSLQAAMNVDQQSIEKRALPVLAAIVVAVLAIEYAALRKDDDAVSRIPVPSTNLAKVSPVQDARIVVFANGGNLITAVPSPTADHG